MSFLGPGVKLKFREERERDRRKRIALITAAVVVVVAIAVTVGVVVMNHDGGGKKTSASNNNSSTAPTTPATAAPTRPHEDPPDKPKAMFGKTKAGLEAAVRYSLDAANYAQRTGDTLPLENLYETQYCKTCEKLLSGLKNDTANGRYIEGAEYSVSAITNAYVHLNESAEVLGDIDATIEQGAGKQRESDGRLVREFPPEVTIITHLKLAFDNGSWHIYSMQARRK